MPGFRGKAEILESLKPILDSLEFVKIDSGTIASFCSRVEPRHIPTPDWESPCIYPGLDETGIDYFILMNCINFCYWGTPKWTVEFGGSFYDGAFAMFAALTRALQAGGPLGDGRFLASLSQTRLRRILKGNVEIPLFQQRLNILRETGRVLADEFEGRFSNVVAQARGSAVKLVGILVDRFASFDDSVNWEGRRLVFHKRAQLAPAMLHERWKGQGAGAFSDISELTVSADYKIPQVLRRLGILRYSPALETLVDDHRIIPANSREEIEIRAATIMAGEMMREVIAENVTGITSQGVDRFIWLIGQTKIAGEKPYHRTLTTMY